MAQRSASAFQNPTGSRSLAMRAPSGKSAGAIFPESAQPTAIATTAARP
jgi:hypothetical protein